MLKTIAFLSLKQLVFFFIMLKTIASFHHNSANVSDMIGEWYVVASTKNDCKCGVEYGGDVEFYST